MFIFRKRAGGGKRAGAAGRKAPGDDAPIIHDRVPEAVLAPSEPVARLADTSWMEAVPLTGATAPGSPRPAAAPERRASRGRPAPAPQAAPAADTFAAAPNPAAQGRPRHPCGWLVVVEGPGLGQWFVLERGVSHVGSAAGQTVRLDFGDDAVASARHAALAYDAGMHAFVLGPGADGARLNGIEVRMPAPLRDGDVITLGQTSLRLAALCSPNFHWEAESAAP